MVGMRKSKSKRTARPKRRVMRKRIIRKRIPRTMNALADRANVVEVFNEGNILGAAFFAGDTNFTLQNFPRALAVSKNYRYYRATKVEVEFIPFANVYAPGQAFPEIYIQKDYTTTTAGQLPGTAQNMLSRGVVPKKWTMIIKRWTTPAVLRYEDLQTVGFHNGNDNMIQDVQPVSATPVKYKWYMTELAYNATQFGVQPVTTQVGPSANPTRLLYHGFTFAVDSPIAQAGNIGKYIVRVHWEFKEPYVIPEAQPPQPLAIAME